MVCIDKPLSTLEKKVTTAALIYAKRRVIHLVTYLLLYSLYIYFDFGKKNFHLNRDHFCHLPNIANNLNYGVVTIPVQQDPII